MEFSDQCIFDYARRFRAAIDAAGPDPWEAKGMKFPLGACGHASELLGRYLIDTLQIRPDYVNEWAYEDMGGWKHSHTWLDWHGLVIDITGDQFGWEPVIVTRFSSFHGKGDPGSRHPVCLEHQQDWWAQNCGSIWEAIQSHLKSTLD